MRHLYSIESPDRTEPLGTRLSLDEALKDAEMYMKVVVDAGPVEVWEVWEQYGEDFRVQVQRKVCEIPKQ